MRRQENDRRSFIPRLLQLAEIGDKAASVVSAIFAVLTYFAGYRWLSYFGVVVACLFLDWVILNTLLRSKRTVTLAFYDRSGKEVSYAAKRISLRSAVGLVSMAIFTLMVVGWVGINGYNDLLQAQTDARRAQGYYVDSVSPENQVILLAEFDAAGTKKYDTTRRIHERLDEELRRANIRNALVVDIPRIKTKEEARTIGQRNNAVFVIWGWYDDIGITPNFTLIKETEEPLIDTETAEVRAEAAKDFSFYIGQGLPTQMSYFAVFTIGQLLYWNQQYDRAVEAFDVAVVNLERSRAADGVPLPAGSETFYFYRGYAYTSINLYELAIADYTRAIELNPQLATAYLNRGNVYFGRGFMNQAPGDFDRAILDYTKVIDLEPHLASAYSNRGNAFEALGKLGQAIADHTKAIELDPKAATAYNNLGNAYQTGGNFDQAIQEYTKSIELNPQSADTYYNRGRAFQLKGNFNQATADYSKAIDLNPKHLKAYINRGTAYFSKGNLTQALADYSKAIEVNPYDAPAYSNRGNIYRAQGRYEQAIADHSKAIKLDPSFPDAYYNRGLDYGEMGNFDQAVQDYTDAIQANPKYVKAYNNRGALFTKRGNLKEAIADFTRAIELDPQYAPGYDNRGRAYRKNGNPAQALADLLLYLRLAPEAGDRAEVEDLIRELR